MLAKKLASVSATAGFPEAFDLRLHSNGAIDALLQVSEFEQGHRSASLAQPGLKRMQRLAGELEQLAVVVDQPMLGALAYGDPAIDATFVKSLGKDLRRLGDAAEAALATVGASCRGRPSEPRVTFAIRELYVLYREHFPDRKGFRVKASAADGCEGEFFDLVQRLFRLMKIRRSGQAICKQIQLATHGIAPPPNPEASCQRKKSRRRQDS